MKSGVLVVDKPRGPTSHDVVTRLRRALKVDRAGHTGTLDPMATGVLPVLLGQATRLARFLNADRKSYVARVRLGIATDTYDSEGRPTSVRRPVPALSPETVEAALVSFRGTSHQRPPVYSAKKVVGRRAYSLARRGAEVTLDPVVVTVDELVAIETGDDWLDLRITSSAGFYVRSLAHDIGERLGCGAHLAALRRTQVGRFTLNSAVPLETLERDPGVAASCGIPMADVLPDLPALRLTAHGLTRACHGNLIDLEDVVGTAGETAAAEPSSFVRLLDDTGDLVAIAESAAHGGPLHPVIVVR